MKKSSNSCTKKATREFEGLRRVRLVEAPNGGYFAIGEWDSFDDIVAARPLMAGNLSKFRHTLKELDGKQEGVTDPISGEVIFSKRYDGKVETGRKRKEEQ
ncbi:hypothetical protein [Rhizobium sp. LjRoot254]|uniref:hypothetical protein n=1 Tax=Rhizobium sp. LjRoot254 TaxID=3342297 RepID=UPI003ECF69B2